MVWKRTTMKAWDQGGIADTDTIKNVTIPKGLYASIAIRLSGTGGAGTPAVDALISRVKLKVAKHGYVVDATGVFLRRLARKKTGTIPKVTNASGAYTEVVVPIYAGRKARDKGCMFDLRNDNVRQLEVSFGTLIATTAWATGTVVMTIILDEWVGAPPPQFKGYMGYKEVEAKATGTGRCQFDLFKGGRLAFLMVNFSAITTVRQITVSDAKGTHIFGEINMRDLLNLDNSESDKETAETLYAVLPFYDGGEEVGALPNLASVSDPAVIVERGSTTTTATVYQGDMYSP